MRQERPWTEDDVRALGTLWYHREPDGSWYSTSEIGRRLGRTKCSVTGKVHRIGLDERPSPIKKSDPSAPRKPRSPPRYTLPSLAAAEPLPQPEIAKIVARPARPALPAVAPHSLLSFGRVISCCWPMEEPGRRYCDEPSEPGKVYCLDHCLKAYIAYVPRSQPAPAV